jgi:hypothetical protein
MAQYTELGNLYNSQNLGSFESYGLSNLGQGLGNLGDFGLVALEDAGGRFNGAMIPEGFHDIECTSPSSCFLKSDNGPAHDVPIGDGTRASSYYVPPPGMAAAEEESGTSAGEVLTGIAAILAPLAQAGVGIYGASQQAKLAEQRLKHGGGRGGGGGDAALLAAISRSQQGGSNTGIIVVVVLLAVGMMGMMMFMMNKKK